MADESKTNETKQDYGAKMREKLEKEKNSTTRKTVKKAKKTKTKLKK